jgi:hypothetical protein
MEILASVHKDCNLESTDPCVDKGVDCISKWKNDKTEQKRQLDSAIVKAEVAKNNLKLAEEWEQRIKSYCDGIEKTAELADKVCREVKTVIKQLEKICKNAGQSVTAIKILFCEVEKIFRNNEGKNNGKDVETLTSMMEDIMKCLKCITDPGLVRDKGIVLVLIEFDAKLKELAGLRLDALKKIIEVLKCANLLYYSLCELDGTDKDDKGQDYPCDSLISELRNLHFCFGNCETKEDCDEKPCEGQKPSSSRTYQGSEGPLETNDCPKDLDPWCCTLAECCIDEKSITPQLSINCLVPRPKFPLWEDDYYTQTKTQYDCAKQDKEKKKCKLDKEKTNKDGLQACYDSLVEAIKAAEAAKNAK